MDVLKFFKVRLCPWDLHLTGRRRTPAWRKSCIPGKNVRTNTCNSAFPRALVGLDYIKSFSQWMDLIAIM